MSVPPKAALIPTEIQYANGMSSRIMKQGITDQGIVVAVFVLWVSFPLDFQHSSFSLIEVKDL